MPAWAAVTSKTNTGAIHKVATRDYGLFFDDTDIVYGLCLSLFIRTNNLSLRKTRIRHKLNHNQ